MKNLIPLLFSFKGRVNRTVFWSFEIVWSIVFVLICVLTPHTVNDDGGYNFSLGTIGTFLVLATFWPLFAIQVKRWHDRNKSGWWCFIALVPFIGAIWALVECGFLPSVNEGNRFNA